MTNDPGSEEFQWPEVSELRPAEAARLLDDIEREATLANKRADTLKKRKAQAKAIVLAVAEDYELESIDTTTAEGQRVKYTPYSFDVFSVTDEEAFKAWAGEDGENYYEQRERLRDDSFRDAMRRRLQDGEPLPPGVTRWTDPRISRTAIKPSNRLSDLS